MSTIATAPLPANVHGLTAGRVAGALRAVGYDARVTYEGHGWVAVTIPRPDGTRVLVHTYTGHPTDPDAATVETYDASPAVGVETTDGDIPFVVWYDETAPDPEQTWGSVTVVELLTFTVAAVARAMAWEATAVTP